MALYSWPGNVREMHNEIQRMIALSGRDAPLGPGLLSARIRSNNGSAHVKTGDTLKERSSALESVVIAAALRRHSGNISRAADELGSRASAYAEQDPTL